MGGTGGGGGAGPERTAALRGCERMGAITIRELLESPTHARAAQHVERIGMYWNHPREGSTLLD